MSSKKLGNDDGNDEIFSLFKKTQIEGDLTNNNDSQQKDKKELKKSTKKVNFLTFF